MSLIIKNSVIVIIGSKQTVVPVSHNSRSVWRLPASEASVFLLGLRGLRRLVDVFERRQ